jgi:hypothetical protein
MSGSPLLDALLVLDQVVDRLEQSLSAAEARAKSGGKRKNNQMDLFAVSMVAVNDTAPLDIDRDEMARRLSRAIAQIENVLHHAA